MFTSHQMGIETYNIKQNNRTKWKNANKKKQTIISDIFRDYLTNSTIHGISYLGEKGKNWIEKTWWIISLILSVIACTFFINETWTKWTEHPVIITFAKDHSPIWDIPFPAVTVCPLNKVRLNNFNFPSIYLSYEEQTKVQLRNKLPNKKFWDIMCICETYKFIKYADNITDENVITNIKMVAPSLNYTIDSPITWKMEDIDIDNAEKFFAEYITSEGLCFTFNALGHKDMYTEQMKRGVNFIDSKRKNTGWSIEDGYSRTNTDKSLADYPLRTTQAGLDHGLQVNLLAEINERSKYCGNDAGGFKMVLHNPAEIPRLSENFFLIPGNQKVIVAVTPKVIRTSKNLINIASKTRNCYFSHERKLRFFKLYTKYNCKTECLANVTLQQCGCLPFYLPRDNKTEICGYGKFACLDDAKDIEFKFLNIIKDSTVNEELDKDEYKILRKCDCLASCDYFDYQVEISQTENLITKIYETDDKNVEETPVNIFFKESQFLALERNELFGQTDFISNIGGILGLFMGFSFLSLLEIVYFVTLRVWCKIYHKNKTDIVPRSQTKVVWVY